MISSRGGGASGSILPSQAVTRPLVCADFFDLLDPFFCTESVEVFCNIVVDDLVFPVDVIQEKMWGCMSALSQCWGC